MTKTKVAPFYLGHGVFYLPMLCVIRTIGPTLAKCTLLNCPSVCLSHFYILRQNYFVVNIFSPPSSAPS